LSDLRDKEKKFVLLSMDISMGEPTIIRGALASLKAIRGNSGNSGDITLNCLDRREKMF
jgi:hypothetical protein